MFQMRPDALQQERDEGPMWRLSRVRRVLLMTARLLARLVVSGAWGMEAERASICLPTRSLRCPPCAE
eukprot:541087-Pyramimonas_sp.AAC.1